LQTDASELERVEELLDRFNVFEAIGFIGREVMHSRFLAFLLDPKRNHGLGDLFLEGFLRKCTESPDGSSLSLGDLQGGDLEQTTVRTEVHTGDGRIDILLLNETMKWAMIVENKVWSSERAGQLDKYYGFTKKTYSDWQILGVYLTPFGSLPSREEDRKRYLPLDYGTVCDLLDASLEHPGSDLSPDVRMAMEHYTAMVRRHIVYDPEITRLCRSIYRKHKKALDLIYETSIGSQAVDRTVLTDLVKSNEGLSFIGENKTYLWFHSVEWEAPALDGLLRFVFHRRPDSLELFLESSPGDERVRRKLFEMGHRDLSLFNCLEDPDTGKYPKLYRRTFLDPDRHKDPSEGDSTEEIRKQWAEFLDEDLPRIDAALKEERWIWESVEAGS
jgi:PD-(D/E)XK nuclease superfamily